jgi:hypothetical protein
MENQTITKKDENTIQVVKSVPVQFDFTPEYLKEQRQRIVDQKEKDNAQRDLEIAEVDAYLAECIKLAVVEKPIEVVEEIAPIEEIKPVDVTVQEVIK